MQHAAPRRAFQGYWPYLRHPMVIHDLGARPKSLKSGARRGNTGPGLARHQDEANGALTQIDALFERRLPQAGGVRGRAAENGAAIIHDRSKTRAAAHPSARNAEAAEPHSRFEGGPEPEKRTEGERKENAILAADPTGGEYLRPVPYHPLPGLGR